MKIGNGVQEFSKRTNIKAVQSDLKDRLSAIQRSKTNNGWKILA